MEADIAAHKSSKTLDTSVFGFLSFAISFFLVFLVEY